MHAASRVKDLPVTLFEIPVYFAFCWMSVTIPNFKLRAMYKIGTLPILVSVLSCSQMTS